VLAALEDRSALVRRLARRIALRRAGARAALVVVLGGRRRFPHPPRAIGVARGLTRAPEPRPPDASARVPA
jgi:hypothetical protein